MHELVPEHVSQLPGQSNIKVYYKQQYYLLKHFRELSYFIVPGGQVATHWPPELKVPRLQSEHMSATEQDSQLPGQPNHQKLK